MMEILSKLELRSGEVLVPELVIVVAWHVWWQCRQLVKGEMIQTRGGATLSIRALATNYI